MPSRPGGAARSDGAERLPRHPPRAGRRRGRIPGHLPRAGQEGGDDPRAPGPGRLAVPGGTPRRRRGQQGRRPAARLREGGGTDGFREAGIRPRPHRPAPIGPAPGNRPAAGETPAGRCPLRARGHDPCPGRRRVELERTDAPTPAGGGRERLKAGLGRRGMCTTTPCSGPSSSARRKPWCRRPGKRRLSMRRWTSSIQASSSGRSRSRPYHSPGRCSGPCSSRSCRSPRRPSRGRPHDVGGLGRSHFAGRRATEAGDGRRRPAGHSCPAAAEADPLDAVGTFPVQGRVLDPDGKPVANAAIYVHHYSFDVMTAATSNSIAEAQSARSRRATPMAGSTSTSTSRRATSLTGTSRSGTGPRSRPWRRAMGRPGSAPGRCSRGVRQYSGWSATTYRSAAAWSIRRAGRSPG